MMKEKFRTDKKFKIICILMIAASIMASVKCIFIGLQVDEEYAVSMPYRLLLGDRMFTQIWDPHQTSAFLIEALMLLYIKLFHTTAGVFIWIRTFATLIHGIISYKVYQMLRHHLPAEYSFYLGILYFNLLPKGYITPEFSNMLSWALTLLLLSLFQLDQQKKPLMAVISSVWMCLMILSYPSAVILFPFILFYLWKQNGYGKKSAFLFALSCFAAGGCYLLYLFSYMSPAELWENLNYLMIGNSGHTEYGISGKLILYTKEAGRAVVICIGYSAFALLAMLLLKFSKKTKSWYHSLNKNNRLFLAAYLILLSGILYQAFHWIRMGQEFEYSYIYTIYFIFLGIAFIFTKKMEKDIGKNILLWVISNLLMFLAVLMLTDLGIFPSVRYISSGIIMAFAAFLLYAEKEAVCFNKKYITALLLLWCFTSIFIKGWEYRDNDGRMQNITCVRGLISEGPAKGMLTQYMQSYMQETTYEEMRQYIEPGSNLLLMDTGGTLSYLFQDVNVASYTTICDPRYNDVLLKYWELNPDKYPDVVALQCWYGDMRWSGGEWLLNWLENDYHAARIIEGKYYWYYFKE